MFASNILTSCNKFRRFLYSAPSGTHVFHGVQQAAARLCCDHEGSIFRSSVLEMDQPDRAGPNILQLRISLALTLSPSQGIPRILGQERVRRVLYASYYGGGRPQIASLRRVTLWIGRRGTIIMVQTVNYGEAAGRQDAVVYCMAYLFTLLCSNASFVI